MKTLEDTARITEPIKPDSTIRLHAPPRAPEDLRFPSDGILSAPNSMGTSQTSVVRTNGSSESLRIGLGQFLLSSPPLPETKEFFRAMQKWEGYVTSVGKDSFRARLVPIVGEGPDQEAEIITEEVIEDDRELIEPNAVFYWSIGYLDKPSGRLRASLLRFRRLPVWSQHELEHADLKAERMGDLFGGH